VTFLPAERTLNRRHLFVQDEIALARTLALTLGAKVETNSYTGAEWLPSARLAWQAAPEHLLWSALSRAVRAPSRIDREFFTPPVAGGPQFESEISDVLELGYRAQLTPGLVFSITGFRHEHDRLATLRPAPGGATFTNDREGRTSGFETWGTWRVFDWARLSAGLVRLHQALRVAPGVIDLAAAQVQRDPREWWNARAAFDLGASAELDLMAPRYGALPVGTPDYTAVDMRLAWRPARQVELSLLVQNLFDRRHVEWSPGAELERGAHVRVRIEL
jgi:iron complex outermembrane receptor protein